MDLRTGFLGLLGFGWAAPLTQTLGPDGPPLLLLLTLLTPVLALELESRICSKLLALFILVLMPCCAVVKRENVGG